MIRSDGLLLTDLYQLTMLEGYFRHGMTGTAAFECFVRTLPEQRSFLMLSGVEQVLDYLEDMHFTPAEIAWLRESGRFSTDFVDWLAELRFEGDVEAMPEGTVFFENEPVLRVVAPLPQAQLAESRIINLLHLETLIASKAARCRLAAPNALLVDFGMRRAHGAEAALLAARASYLAGFDGSATVVAGARFDVPLYGTMGHSFVQAHDHEENAFKEFAQAQPDNVVLLIDTYDTVAGAARAAALADTGVQVKAVRIDSGDLAALAHEVRQLLDHAGHPEIRIFVSGDLDEYKLNQMMQAAAPIDGFGIGTKLNTSADAPFLNCAYKLQEYAGRPRRKRSPGKENYPGRRQVYRLYDDTGRIIEDWITCAWESRSGRPLLVARMQNGHRLPADSSMQTLRERARSELASLPAGVARIEGAERVPVRVSAALEQLAVEVDQAVS